MRAVISILLSLSMLVTAHGCATELVSGAEPAMKTTEAASAVVGDVVTAVKERAEEEATENGGVVLSADDALAPEYERFETAAFLDDCDRLASCDDAQEAIELYDALYEQYLQMLSMYEVAYIANSVDVTDAYWTQESLWCETEAVTAGDALCVACHDVLEGPCAEAFRAHVGESAAEVFAAYEPASERIEELSERESALCSDYYAAMSGIDSLVVEYRGEQWTMERWSGQDGDDLYWDDYDAYSEVYDLLMKAANEAVGPIYVELVGIRREIAEYYGYDNYAEYAYENVYCRDYGMEEAEAFCEQVKQIAPRYYEQVYYHRRASGYSGVQMDGQELVDTLGAYAEQIDPLVSEVWEFFADNELYSICDSSECMDGGYTVSIPSSDAPYIYMSLYGGSSDFCTITHEFGHYVDAYVTPTPNYLTSGGNYDLLEIHSNGLEVLYSRFYDDIFGIGANTATFGMLTEQLDSVVSGCIYDEFQRRVYTEEDITLEDINRIYSEVCVAYGEYDEVYEDCWWIYVSHNFESPMYYISYAASAIAALQIWDLSREDYDAAVDMWLAVLREGAYDKGYMEVLADCGLQSFADEGAVEAVCTPVLDYLEQIG